VKANTKDSTRITYSQPVVITEGGDYGATVLDKKGKVISSWVWQRFAFNKATGKTISLRDQPSKNYPGSGAFTLVNGIITDKGLVQSSEWLGFLGKNMEATIDLGEATNIHSVTVNALDQNGSWIYLPKRVVVKVSRGDSTKDMEFIVDQIPPGTRRITVPVNTTAKSFTVIAENYGIIPLGQPGAGTPAWLFVDEIEVD
jgi:hexosaminidase